MINKKSMGNEEEKIMTKKTAYHFDTIPPSIGDLGALEDLEMRSCGFSMLPDEFCNNLRFQLVFLHPGLSGLQYL